MVYENAILFLRDSLISREFTDAVQAGDSGRVVPVLKVWALSFRGNGRTKYAYEMLHLIHNLKVVWPEEMKCVNGLLSVECALTFHIGRSCSITGLSIGPQVARNTSLSWIYFKSI